MAALNKTVAQYLTDVGNAAVPYTSADIVTILDTGANIAGLSAAQLALLSTHRVDAIDASNNAITFTLSKFQALNKKVFLALTDTITINATGVADKITGRANDESIAGGAGNDTIKSGDGDDTVSAG